MVWCVLKFFHLPFTFTASFINVTAVIELRLSGRSGDKVPYITTRDTNPCPFYICIGVFGSVS